MNFLISSFLGFMFTFISFCSISQTSDSIPVHQTFSIFSKKLDELRIINVWTPPNYEVSLDSFSVMYMADGGINEDFPHIANTLAKLIQEHKIKPLILVGIENTQRRRDLTGFTEVKKDKEIAPIVGGSEKFRAFIKDELFIEIQSKFRTSDEKSLIGESLSGLFVMETFFLTPDMFDNYIAFDPSLWWNNHYLVKLAKNYATKIPLTGKKLWFAGSNTKDISRYTKRLAKILKNESFFNLKWMYSNEPKETHATIFRETKEKAFIWILNK